MGLLGYLANKMIALIIGALGFIIGYVCIYVGSFANNTIIIVIGYIIPVLGLITAYYFWKKAERRI